MHRYKAKAVLLLLAGALVLGLLALASAIGPRSSEAQQGAMQNCPQAHKWAISVWSGDDGTGAEQAFATCDAGAIVAAYYLVPEDQTWQRWFAGRPLVSTLETLNDMQGVIALGAVGAPAPTPTPTPALGSGQLANCPQPNNWAISVWTGPDNVDTESALATCPDTAVVAAYWLDPDTQGWLRYFQGRPQLSNLLTLGNLQGIIVLGDEAAPTPTATPVPSPTPTPTPTPVSGEVAITGELVAIFTYLTTFQPPDFITTTTTIVAYKAAIEDDSGNLMLLFSPDTRMQRVYGNGLELILTVAGYTYTHSWPFMDEPLPSCRGARVYLSRSGKRITVTGVVEAFTGCPIEGDMIRVETIEEVP